MCLCIYLSITKCCGGNELILVDKTSSLRITELLEVVINIRVTYHNLYNMRKYLKLIVQLCEYHLIQDDRKWS